MGFDVAHLVWAKDLTITEVARRAGHDEAYVNRLLHGKLPVMPAMARKLEAASGIPDLAAMMLGFHPIPLDRAS